MRGKLKSPLWELQNRDNKIGICEMCKQETTLTVDHIFPSSLLVMWGLIEEISKDGENLQLICKACQILKNSRFDFHNPKTIPLIEKYIGILKTEFDKNRFY